MRAMSLGPVKGLRKEHALLGALLGLWGISPELVHWLDSTAGYIDQSIWMLVVLSLISFMMVVGLCWWMLDRFWTSMELPRIGRMVTGFKEMELWVQLGFYLGCFALLVFAAVGCLAAIL
jgi:hypothetical protein